MIPSQQNDKIQSRALETAHPVLCRRFRPRYSKFLPSGRFCFGPFLLSDSFTQNQSFSGSAAAGRRRDPVVLTGRFGLKQFSGADVLTDRRREVSLSWTQQDVLGTDTHSHGRQTYSRLLPRPLPTCQFIIVEEKKMSDCSLIVVRRSILFTF